MTKDMIILYEKLITIEVRTLSAAFNFLTDQMNEMSFYGKLKHDINRETLKSTRNGYKLIKKILKGKIEMDFKDVFEEYDKDTNEYFFLKCLVRIVETNQLKK